MGGMIPEGSVPFIIDMICYAMVFDTISDFENFPVSGFPLMYIFLRSVTLMH